MKATFRLFVTLLLLIGWGLAASALHVVWTGDSPLIIPKERIGVSDTYVNISNWTPDDVSNHPAVVRRIVAVGKTDRLSHVFKDADSKTVRGIRCRSTRINVDQSAVGDVYG